MSHEPSTATPADELYDRAIRPLSAPERLRLAARILADLDPNSMVDYSSEWTDEDMRDITLHSLRHASASFGEDEADA